MSLEKLSCCCNWFIFGWVIFPLIHQKFQLVFVIDTEQLQKSLLSWVRTSLASIGLICKIRALVWPFPKWESAWSGGLGGRGRALWQLRSSNPVDQATPAWSPIYGKRIVNEAQITKFLGVTNRNDIWASDMVLIQMCRESLASGA